MDRWGACSRDFGNYLRTSGRSEQTARTYLSNVLCFYRWTVQREADPRCVDRSWVRAYLAERETQVSSQRVHNDLAALRLWYEFGREERWRDDNPTTGLKIKRGKKLPTEPIWEAELDALLAACTDERDRLMVLVLAYTGMRISEMASLTAEHFDWQHGILRIVGKGDKERRLAPHPDVLHRLHAYLGMFPSGPIWLSKRSGGQLSAHQIRKIIYGIADRAGVEGVHPHRFRAFFGTNFVKQFKDMQALQGLMGHESIETTARYTEWTREERGLEMQRRFGDKGLSEVTTVFKEHVGMIVIGLMTIINQAPFGPTFVHL